MEASAKILEEALRLYIRRSMGERDSVEAERMLDELLATAREDCAKIAEQCDGKEPSIYGKGVADACRWIALTIRDAK